MASQERDTIYNYFIHSQCPVNVSPVVINVDNVYFSSTLVFHGQAISGSGLFVECNINNFTPKVDNLNFIVQSITALSSDRTYNGVNYVSQNGVYISQINNLSINNGNIIKGQSYTFTSTLCASDNNYMTLNIYCGYGYNAYNVGLQESLDSAYDVGYNAGYQSGYSAGASSDSDFTGVFSLLGQAFDSAGGLMETSIIGGLSIGALITIPFAITVVVSVLRLIRK